MPVVNRLSFVLFYTVLIVVDCETIKSLNRRRMSGNTNKGTIKRSGGFMIYRPDFTRELVQKERIQATKHIMSVILLASTFRKSFFSDQ